MDERQFKTAWKNEIKKTGQVVVAIEDGTYFVASLCLYIDLFDYIVFFYSGMSEHHVRCWEGSVRDVDWIKHIAKKTSEVKE